MHFLYFVVTEPKEEFDWKKVNQEVQSILEANNFANSDGGSNCLQKPYNIHRNRLKTLAFYY